MLPSTVVGGGGGRPLPGIRLDGYVFDWGEETPASGGVPHVSDSSEPRTAAEWRLIPGVFVFPGSPAGAGVTIPGVSAGAAAAALSSMMGLMATPAAVRPGSQQQECQRVTLFVAKKTNADVDSVMRRDVKILTKLKHPNFVDVLVPLQETDELLYFVTSELLGSLAMLRVGRQLQYAVDGKGQGGSEPPFALNDLEIRSMLFSVCQGLQWLHTTVGRIHRRLTADCVFLAPNCRAAKIAGLGCSLLLPSGPGRTSLVTPRPGGLLGTPKTSARASETSGREDSNRSEASVEKQPTAAGGSDEEPAEAISVGRVLFNNEASRRLAREVFVGERGDTRSDVFGLAVLMASAYALPLRTEKLRQLANSQDSDDDPQEKGVIRLLLRNLSSNASERMGGVGEFAGCSFFQQEPFAVLRKLERACEVLLDLGGRDPASGGAGSIVTWFADRADGIDTAEYRYGAEVSLHPLHVRHTPVRDVLREYESQVSLMLESRFFPLFASLWPSSHRIRPQKTADIDILLCLAFSSSSASAAGGRDYVSGRRLSLLDAVKAGLAEPKTGTFNQAVADREETVLTCLPELVSFLNFGAPDEIPSPWRSLIFGLAQKALLLEWQSVVVSAPLSEHRVSQVHRAVSALCGLVRAFLKKAGTGFLGLRRLTPQHYQNAAEQVDLGNGMTSADQVIQLQSQELHQSAAGSSAGARIGSGDSEIFLVGLREVGSGTSLLPCSGSGGEDGSSASSPLQSRTSSLTRIHREISGSPQVFAVKNQILLPTANLLLDVHAFLDSKRDVHSFSDQELLAEVERAYVFCFLTLQCFVDFVPHADLVGDVLPSIFLFVRRFYCAANGVGGVGGGGGGAVSPASPLAGNKKRSGLSLSSSQGGGLGGVAENSSSQDSLASHGAAEASSGLLAAADHLRVTGESRANVSSPKIQGGKPASPAAVKINPKINKHDVLATPAGLRAVFEFFGSAKQCLGPLLLAGTVVPLLSPLLLCPIMPMLSGDDRARCTRIFHDLVSDVTDAARQGATAKKPGASETLKPARKPSGSRTYGHFLKQYFGVDTLSLDVMGGRAHDGADAAVSPKSAAEAEGGATPSKSASPETTKEGQATTSLSEDDHGRPHGASGSARNRVKRPAEYGRRPEANEVCWSGTSSSGDSATGEANENGNKMSGPDNAVEAVSPSAFFVDGGAEQSKVRSTSKTKSKFSPSPRLSDGVRGEMNRRAIGMEQSSAEKADEDVTRNSSEDAEETSKSREKNPDEDGSASQEFYDVAEFAPGELAQKIAEQENNASPLPSPHEAVPDENCPLDLESLRKRALGKALKEMREALGPGTPPSYEETPAASPLTTTRAAGADSNGVVAGAAEALNAKMNDGALELRLVAMKELEEEEANAVEPPAFLDEQNRGRAILADEIWPEAENRVAARRIAEIRYAILRRRKAVLRAQERREAIGVLQRNWRRALYARTLSEECKNVSEPDGDAEAGAASTGANSVDDARGSQAVKVEDVHPFRDFRARVKRLKTNFADFEAYFSPTVQSPVHGAESGTANPLLPPPRAIAAASGFDAEEHRFRLADDDEEDDDDAEPTVFSREQIRKMQRAKEKKTYETERVTKRGPPSKGLVVKDYGEVGAVGRSSETSSDDEEGDATGTWAAGGAALFAQVFSTRAAGADAEGGASPESLKIVAAAGAAKRTQADGGDDGDTVEVDLPLEGFGLLHDVDQKGEDEHGAESLAESDDSVPEADQTVIPDEELELDDGVAGGAPPAGEQPAGVANVRTPTAPVAQPSELADQAPLDTEAGTKSRDEELASENGSETEAAAGGGDETAESSQPTLPAREEPERTTSPSASPARTQKKDEAEHRQAIDAAKSSEERAIAVELEPRRQSLSNLEEGDPVQTEDESSPPGPSEVAEQANKPEDTEDEIIE
mmetsp:Transcript_11932/g.28903  ORF Transcript_11932/g.28903 Transcript_11932/m.28903 type:complete len:1917 (-) Transcript_11932:355-6105(-)